MPLFTLPLALIGLASLPAAVAIYWLRNRLKRQEVSSLHLWLGQREAREGGQRVQKLQLPWLLLLELLALALIVLAATDPRVLMGQQQRQLVVVLDDSFSMQAGAQERARKVLAEQLEKESPLAVRLVLARQSPVVLSSLLTKMEQVDEALAGWRCESQMSDLDQAVSLAFELGGSQGRVLVLTDRRPVDEGMMGVMLGQSRLVWRALGSAQPKVAIINAVRSVDEGAGERALVEVANLSSQSAEAVLSVNGRPRQLNLAAGQVQRLWVNVGDASQALTFELSPDALEADNRVILLPGQRERVKVQISVKDEVLRQMLGKAVGVSTLAHVVSSDGDLLMTDSADAGFSAAGRWLVRWLVDEEAQPFVGPFLLDTQHPLANGVELEGVVWGASSTGEMVGQVVLAAGNTPLVSYVDRSSARGAQYDVLVRLNPGASTVGATPAFPVLVWNMIAWRQSALPGLSQSNVRAGMEASFTPVRVSAEGRGVTSGTAANDESEAGGQGQQTAVVRTPRVRVTTPGGQVSSYEVHGQSLAIQTQQPGVYEILSDEKSFRVAANLMSREESDLSQQTTASFGQWETAATLRQEYTSIAWALLLGVLGVLGLHMFLTWRGGGGGA